MTLLLDTHVLRWWTAEPDRVSAAAARAITEADELAVAAISWWELTWLVEHGRLVTAIPVRSWLGALSRDIRTAPLTPAIAATAAALPGPFPRDPADRLIWATAVENGWRLVTADARIHAHDPERRVTTW